MKRTEKVLKELACSKLDVLHSCTVRDFGSRTFVQEELLWERKGLFQLTVLEITEWSRAPTPVSAGGSLVMVNWEEKQAKV